MVKKLQFALESEDPEYTLIISVMLASESLPSGLVALCKLQQRFMPYTRACQGRRYAHHLLEARLLPRGLLEIAVERNSHRIGI